MPGFKTFGCFWLMVTSTVTAQVAAGPLKVPDTIAQRVVPCTTCHGKEGRATNDGFFPRIASKPAGDLYNQLVNFRDGRRHYASMTYLVLHLNDDYLHEMAAYFAALDPPYPPPQRPSASAEALSRGEALVRRSDAGRNIPACTECHGKTLLRANPLVPGLLGLPRDYLQAQLGRWKNGERRAHAPDCMAKIATQLTPAEIAAVSAWLAAQAVPANAKQVARATGPLPMECGGLPK
ncbi:MAG: c-type cytochrome [Burkholderiales bacterium]